MRLHDNWTSAINSSRFVFKREKILQNNNYSKIIIISKMLTFSVYFFINLDFFFVFILWFQSESKTSLVVFSLLLSLQTSCIIQQERNLVDTPGEWSAWKALFLFHPPALCWHSNSRSDWAASRTSPWWSCWLRPGQLMFSVMACETWQITPPTPTPHPTLPQELQTRRIHHSDRMN